MHFTFKGWSLVETNEQLLAAIALIELDMTQLNKTVEELSVEAFSGELFITPSTRRDRIFGQMA